MEKYDHKKIEKKWQKKWEEDELYKTSDDTTKPKSYVLDMFPYPSGEGLHVGHPKGYIATDIYSRYKRMTGYNVLHPMGWDAFGLPAENFAIKNKIHPKVSVDKNIKRFKEQLLKIGFSYDWGKEINTTDPEYYKWTQWIFIQMFKKGLAYESYEPINWCPSCKTGLANEDLDGGVCERCGSQVEQRPMRQWILKITKYADRLLKDLNGLDWEEHIKEMQRNWIGRSEGINFKEKVKDMDIEFEVYDSIPQTFLAQTFTVIAPEHPLVDKLVRGTKYEKSVLEFVEKIKKKKLAKKFDIDKDMEGIFTGRYVDNPFGTGDLPIWVASFVLADYGTGIVNCSAHDKRDFDFAKKYNISLKIALLPRNQQQAEKVKNLEIFYKEPDGIIQEPKEFKGMTWKDAREPIIRYIEKNKLGTKAIHYRLRDWVFSRQRYWGEPIPLIHCEGCGVVSVPEEDLPVVLPEVEFYEPTGTGESPLASIDEWINVSCPECDGSAKRESNTMPQWAGSSWYYLRYIDPNNSEALVDKEKEKYWSPVDMYVGGAEHATRHLIYARFWHKFLYDIGVVNYVEPFNKLQHVGLINAEDGRKMSKRWNNVINPDNVVEQFGADSLRLYEMFMGPFDQAISWSTDNIVGVRKFIEKVWKLQNKISDSAPHALNKKLETLLHKTVKKVGEDIEDMKFNTAVSTMMILVNEFEKKEQISKEIFSTFLILLAPFAPHVTEELWEKLGNNISISKAEWPKYDPLKITKDTVSIAVQINGKVRASIEISIGEDEEKVKEKALLDEKVKKWTIEKNIKKVLYIKGRIVSIVTD